MKFHPQYARDLDGSLHNYFAALSEMIFTNHFLQMISLQVFCEEYGLQNYVLPWGNLKFATFVACSTYVLQRMYCKSIGTLIIKQ